MQSADYSMTEAAFAAAEGKTTGDEHLLVRFFYEPTKDEVQSKEQGRPIFKDGLWIEISKPGDRLPIRKGPARQRDIERFPLHHEKFMSRTQEQHVEGTLLEHWPAVIRSQVEELRFFNIRTVEQLASMPDSSTNNFRGAIMLKEKAKAYLEASKGNATAEALDEAKKDNLELKAQLQALTERLESVEAVKPKRKRRTKAEMAAQE